ncbi:pyridoxamine 5'-phosphate oxidase family protein [Shewanella basaltis]|uniref:pyridoxamine 5'-phosphate oxidase family protein n=1 Tax=Shewanella basaltis TaxID=472183 RepID=UPI00200EEFE4|nr:pyridoxamine 5'-phosphate oxidase family protein [Shewanella basaltis]MCL1114417.1 pyridoxamine 5'-phosphate oxidase family protein [Shewanella basaltis]
MNKPLAPSWHQGELAIQQRAGTDKRMADIGPKFIRQYLPQQHRDFFESLSMLFIGYAEQPLHTRASVLFGTPGFVQCVSDTELLINTQHSMGDFIHAHLAVGDRIGILGIVFTSKRRNRVNGMITDINQKSIRVTVLQSYGNCPKYIQPIAFMANQDYGKFMSSTKRQLSQADKHLITHADTFFIASGFEDGQQLNNRGADISHRGGPQGFVSINEQGQLMVNDYPGNGFFNTLGNLLENPIASLLFCDWQHGHALHINVSSQIIWQHVPHVDGADVNTTAGTQTERTLCFTPLNVEQFVNGLAYRQANLL